VGEQHAEGDFAPPRVDAAVVGAELRDGPGDGSVKFEQAALVKHHGHGGRSDGLGQGGYVEERGRCDGEIKISDQSELGRGTREIFSIDKASERFQRQQFALQRDRDRSGWEGVLIDGLAKDGEGSRKAGVLISEVGDEGGSAVQDELP
jgi:hypothetical protein